jgi:hypothetical protein
MSALRSMAGHRLRPVGRPAAGRAEAPPAMLRARRGQAVASGVASVRTRARRIVAHRAGRHSSRRPRRPRRPPSPERALGGHHQDGQGRTTRGQQAGERPHVGIGAVEGDASLYDGDLLYWASRLGYHPEVPPTRATLLKRQKGRCTWCGLHFASVDDLMEVDHTVPRAIGGTDRTHNRQVLHGHCHDAKTAGTVLIVTGRPRRGAHDTGDPPRSGTRGNSHVPF